MKILLLGKPGAGKGTLAYQILKNNKDMCSLSTGDLLRIEAQRNKDLAAELAKGRFATQEQITGLVMHFLQENENKSVLFDGYPRTLEQLDSCNSKSICFDLILNLEVKDELLLCERIVNRICHVSSGRIYNIKTSPPKISGYDDWTSEELTTRADDNERSFITRMALFEKVTKPLIEKLKGHENFKEIDATQSIEKIYRLVEMEIKKKMTNEPSYQFNNRNACKI